MKTHVSLSYFFLLCSTVLFSQVTTGRIDDFENGTTQGWIEPSRSTNPPTNEATDGPGGVNDNYIENISSGGNGPGSRLVMFNMGWNGDYNTLGIVGIRMDVRNSGTTAINLRVSFQGSGTDRISSTNAVVVPVGSGWVTAEFPISDFSVVQGTSTVSDVLSNVSVIRILSSGTPNWRGESIAATLDVDNVEAAATLSVIDFVKQGDDFKVFPNPVTEKLILSIPEAYTNVVVEIFDVSGKMLISTDTNKTKQLDIASFDTGLYHLRFITENNETVIKRFLKE